MRFFVLHFYSVETVETFELKLSRAASVNKDSQVSDFHQRYSKLVSTSSQKRCQVILVSDNWLLLTWPHLIDKLLSTVDLNSNSVEFSSAGAI